MNEIILQQIKANLCVKTVEEKTEVRRERTMGNTICRKTDKLETELKRNEMKRIET